jgi:hypothetical protein
MRKTNRITGPLLPIRAGQSKATRKKLRAIGIKLTEVPRCAWGKT